MSAPMNRRTFVQTSGLATAALTASSLWSLHAEGKKRSFRKGIMFQTVGVKGSVLDKFKAIKEAGFEGVEPVSHMDVEEVLRARDATGLLIPSVCCNTHWAKPLTHPSESVRKESLEGLQQALRDAKRYGASSVLFVCGAVNQEISYADAWDRAVDGIHKAVPLAAELGVRISIENVWNNFLLSPLEAARFVDEFKSPWVGWHFDVGNVIHYGWPEQWIRVLGKRINMVHIKEYSRAKSDKEGRWAGFNVEFLKGDNNWPAVMKAFDDIGYQTWGIAEQGGAGSPEGLRKLSEEMDRIFAS